MFKIEYADRNGFKGVFGMTFQDKQEAYATAKRLRGYHWCLRAKVVKD